MYWLNTSKLTEDLREGRVDEKERCKYFLATFIGWSVAGLLFLHSGRTFSTDGLISIGVILAIAIVGIILCYRVNKSGDNIDFIPRMICLGWQSGLWLAPFGYFFLLRHATESEVFFLGIALVVIYFASIYGNLVDVARAKEGRILVEMFATDLSFGKAALGLLMFPGSIFLFAMTQDYVTKHAGMEIIARLVGLSATALWLILLGWFFAVLHKRAVKRS